MDDLLKQMIAQMGCDPDELERRMAEQEKWEEAVLKQAAEYEKRTGKPFIEIRKDIP